MHVLFNCMIFFHDKLSSFNVNGLLYNANKTWWNLTIQHCEIIIRHFCAIYGRYPASGKKVDEYLKTKKNHNNVYISYKSVFKVKTNICYLTHILTGYIGKSLSTLTKDKIQNAKRWAFSYFIIFVRTLPLKKTLMENTDTRICLEWQVVNLTMELTERKYPTQI